MVMGLKQQGGRGKFSPMAEINVTPMVDVMLVLLIIFMVAAPLLTVGIEVNLPDTEAQNLSEQTEPLTVSVTAEGNIFVQDTQIEYDNLVPHLTAIAQAGYDQAIYVRGDRDVDWDRVAKVLGQLSKAGFRQISLVTD
jgi:biopolymer transport protein TolR